MLIEIAEAGQVDALLGVDTRDYVRLEVGPHIIVGTFEAGHSDEERGKISTVHFVRFPLSLDVQRAFGHHEVTLVVNHPNEHARTVLSPETTRSLAADLA